MRDSEDYDFVQIAKLSRDCRCEETARSRQIPLIVEVHFRDIYLYLAESLHSA